MRQLPSYCGCYSLTLDGVVYVGVSTLTRRRTLNHVWKLRKGIHPCKKLQVAFNRTGQNPEFELLEECDEKSLREREVYWVKRLNAVNLPGAGVRKGHKFGPPSLETRRKIGDANRRKP